MKDNPRRRVFDKDSPDREFTAKKVRGRQPNGHRPRLFPPEQSDKDKRKLAGSFTRSRKNLRVFKEFCRKNHLLAKEEAQTRY